MCWLLCVRCCVSLFVILYLSIVANCSLSGVSDCFKVYLVCSLSCVVCCLCLVVLCLIVVVRWLMYVTVCVCLIVACWLLLVVCC